MYRRREDVLGELGVSKSTANGRWRISDLREKNILTPVSRTWCVIKPERRFVIHQGNRERDLVRIVMEIADTYCVWSIRELNALMMHQRIRRLIFVEVDKGATKRVFEEFVDRRIRNVILQTDTKWVLSHIGGTDFDVIVKPIVSRAPLEDAKRGTPSLEKIIVDLFEDGQVYGVSRSTDLAHIIRMAFTDFTIDLRTLRTYAKRRGVFEHLLKFISWLNIVPKEVLDDP